MTGKITGTGPAKAILVIGAAGGPDTSRSVDPVTAPELVTRKKENTKIIILMIRSIDRGKWEIKCILFFIQELDSRPIKRFGREMHAHI